MTYDQVVKFYGGVTAASQVLVFTRAAIYYWRDNGIPIRTQQWIETRTDGRLRMDAPKKKRRKNGK